MLRGSRVQRLAKTFTARRFASTAPAQTKYTTLSNGVTVATESNPQAPTSTVGLYIGGGSRTEHPLSNGIAALTTNILAASQSESIKAGILLSSENKRELNAVVAQSTNANVTEAAKLIATIASNSESILEHSNFAVARGVLEKKAAAIEANPSSRVLEHLNASAYQGYSLGLPVNGTEESIKDLEVQDSSRFLSKYLVGGNTVIAASGNFEHDALVNAIESNLKIKQGSKPETKSASFLGSEVRMRDDTMDKAYVAIAAQGESVSSPAYYVAKVAAAVFGDFDHKSPLAHFTSPKLASIVQEYHIVDKYTHFSHSYSDTGLWGFNAEISNVEAIDEFTHFALKEWNRLSISITDAEVVRAKAAVKTALLQKLSTSSAVASDIGGKVLLAGYRSSLTQALESIDAITTKDVKAWAQATLWDRDIVVSGTGRIEALLDYNRNRNDMAMMRW